MSDVLACPHCGGRPEIRMLLLHRLQALQQLVELPVRDDRRVPHVVPELVTADLLGQRVPLLLLLG